MGRPRIGALLRSHRVPARVLGEARVLQLKRGQSCPEFKVFLSAVKRGSTVIDVGASVGNFSLAAARRVGSRGRVLAFEPNPAVFRELVNSTRGTVVTPLELALSDRAQQAELHVPLDSRGGAAFPLGSLEPRTLAKDQEVLGVNAVKLDELVPPTADVSVIKVDVEGHELKALKGASRILETRRPQLIVEIEERHLAQGSISDVVDWVVGKGYEAFAIAPGALISWDRFDVETHQRIPLKHAGQPSAPTYLNNFWFRPIGR